MKIEKPVLPKVVNCQTCGALAFVKWEPVDLAREGFAYFGSSLCGRCRSKGVHVVGDPEFLKSYAKSVDLPGHVQVDIFSKDASGRDLHSRIDAVDEDGKKI